jgi:hypothetical protein
MPVKSGFEQVHLARRFGASNLVKTSFCGNYTFSRDRCFGGNVRIGDHSDRTSNSTLKFGYAGEVVKDSPR